ncbi:restriction endonuclease subunit S [Staphylococcus haemolyticus]|uniref:restriction endonuclease subunit S n=1 Tax=Staphylococcus haemolyticus TaxID=1283 RepID=UPI0015D7604D|nr:restriction endonuclease subunit S [Staphylococcus haemolyticus]
MTEQSSTPELRFPEFKEKLTLQKLNSVASVTMGQSPKSNNYTDDSKQITLVQGNTDLKNGEINSRIYTTEITKIAKVQDIILTVRAPVGELAIAQKEVCIGRGVCAIKANKFIYYFLEKFKIDKLWARLSQGSTFEAISGNDIKNISVTLPSKKEQTKIGDFFSKLDQQIELEEKKLELLEQQKRGYIQKVFSQELRFKDENGNSYPKWSIKKIEDISKVNKGFTPNTKNNEYWDELNENWLSIAGMTQKYLYKGNKGITEKGASKHAKVDKDTLIMSFKLTLGKLAIVKEPIYTNEAICHFVWKESNVSTEYMYYYLNSINISTFGAQAVKGVTLNNDSINSIIVKLPVIEEQNKIAYFFNKLDKLIRKQYDKIEVLKQRKKGLLQKMFI